MLSSPGGRSGSSQIRGTTEAADRWCGEVVDGCARESGPGKCCEAGSWPDVGADDAEGAPRSSLLRSIRSWRVGADSTRARELARVPSGHGRTVGIGRTGTKGEKTEGS